MGSLVLDSITIENFRAFQRLNINQFQRVNLVVGKNNVGKSTLLEAIRLYAYRGSIDILWQILEGRDEGRRTNAAMSVGSNPDDETTQDQLSVIKSLFYGRQTIKARSSKAVIGPAGADELRLSLWVEPYTDSQLPLLENAHLDDYALHVTYGRMDLGLHPLSRPVSRRTGMYVELPAIPCVTIPITGIPAAQIEKWWDAIALTPSEADVLDALRIISPQVERLSLIARRGNRTYPIVRLQGMDEPVPLRSLGEGMVRLFWIALALANSKNGILLIDEVDTGLHYSVQSLVWKLIFETAERLNVQVFATTHSQDCIKAFQKSSRAQNEEGMLISLRRRKDNPNEIVSILYDEDKLEIATQEHIEVR